ncbi:hypothetical protein LINPERHAP1_LOCUS16 [Linum perenne]
MLLAAWIYTRPIHQLQEF